MSDAIRGTRGAVARLSALYHKTDEWGISYHDPRKIFVARGFCCGTEYILSRAGMFSVGVQNAFCRTSREG